MKFAIVSASGIGDGLLMQIFAAHLQRLGHETVTFSNSLHELQDWFPRFHFCKQPSIEETFPAFDAIVLQHDNSEKAKAIRNLKKPIFTLFGSYSFAKHGKFCPESDWQCDQTLCMAENIRRSAERFFPGRDALLDNGLIPLPTLTFRRYPKRVILHPISTSTLKNWNRKSFLKLRDCLARKGWDPVFIAPPAEAEHWDSPPFPTLSALASFLYESNCLIGNDSGPGHLASNLGLPTLTIANSPRQLAFWRPGWSPGQIAHPPTWLSEFTLFKRNWKMFVSVNQVIKKFNKINKAI